jgi:outer membrane protein TolC
VESRNLALTQARELLQETQLLAKAGKATDLDVETAQLGVASAENDVFQAWADLYGARLDLIAARS